MLGARRGQCYLARTEWAGGREEVRRTEREGPGQEREDNQGSRTRVMVKS